MDSAIIDSVQGNFRPNAETESSKVWLKEWRQLQIRTTDL